MIAREGVWAASVTPFNADLSIDFGALCAHVDWLLENGCDGVALMGTTGEGTSVGVNERLALIEELEGRWPEDRIMLGVGTPAVPDTVNLILKAIDHEFGNVLMLPPYYFKNPPDDGLFQTVVEIVRRLGREMPKIHMYDFPQMVGFPLSAGVLARMNDAWPDIVVGMKDSSGDFDKMSSVLSRIPKFRVYAGTEELLVPIRLKGGAGCISATVNVTSQQAGRVWAALQDGDVKQAEIEQTKLTTQRLALQNWPMVPGVKAVLRKYFPDRMNRMIRPPLLALSDLDRERLFKALDEIAFEIEGI
ncbi:MAG: dihydrodipicolinate synthase family protein [Minwuia sp.]|uniref:dihydrodipicolinate synthase family protein n=1 Tax=Minwuia sp. TaxID=2493630 RepID=UPI003A83E8F9